MRAKIIIPGLIYLLLLGSVLFAGEKKGIKSWLDYFPDPVERVYVVMKDEIAFKFTNHEERLVYMGAGILEDFLKKKEYKIKDIAFIIHNHRFEQKFSPADWKFYNDLKRRSFNGLFLLYCHRTKEVYDIEEKKEKDIYELMKEASKPKEKDVLEPSRLTDDYEHRFSWLDKYYSDLKKKEEKKEISWDEKYRMYPSTKYWLNSLKDPDERYLEKIEEENDRLEDLLRELRNEKSELEWDMMRYKSDLEWHMLELSSRLEFDFLFNPLLYFPFGYRYEYPRQTDRTNYEPLLFTLCTDSKGKMDWTKYGWLKLLLKNK